MYAGVTTDGELIVKVKGLRKDSSSDITFDQITSLLQKDHSLSFDQTKSYKSLSEGSIKLIKEAYNLVATDSKRELVYNEDGLLVKTIPFRISSPHPAHPVHSFYEGYLLSLRRPEWTGEKKKK